MTSSFIPGQRWLSNAEPELGLGTVLRVAGRSVQIVFTGSDMLRHYAMASAPLLRAAFRPGDRVRAHGVDHEIEQVEERNGLLYYLASGKVLAEGELDADQPVSQADSRLLAGRFDRSAQFEFRLEALQRRAEALRHPGWGVLGARIDLIPHQLRVAEVGMQRRSPRLLLADEVGLGKTIEAGLLIARQLATGRAGRVLVLVPESLIHQWFIELLRRFNLHFALYDEERCEAIVEAAPQQNPFEDEQCVIAAIDWLAESAKRREQLLAAGWDLLVVDEAHHLAWSPDAPSDAYALVESLAAATPGVLLLTATPEQLGRDGHFARLRLLDPSRYADLERFLAESGQHRALSPLVDRMLQGTPPDAADVDALRALYGTDDAELDALLSRAQEGSAEAREALIDALVDRHGTGRVMVRNRRAAVGGFPERIRQIDLLPDNGDDPTLQGRLRAELLADINAPGHAEPEHDYARDPRLDWLLELLETIAPAKALLLCRSRAKVQALDEALRLRSGLSVSRFHEDMNLLQRDRAAAYFAEPEGARLLIASEIGAEGRNFQFAQHLILWDLPLDPDMLEQRIGRLDRIGQQGAVHIHGVALEGSPQDRLLRWYDEGLDAFRSICADGRELLRRFGDELRQRCAEEADDAAMEDLVERTRAAHAELSAAIDQGRDHLLEIASQRGAASGSLLAALAADDAERADDDFPLRLLEQFGVQHEALDDGIFVLDPEYLTVDAFGELKDGPRRVTFERTQALSRDDLMFLRDDHPLLQSATDLLLAAEAGNAAVLIDDALPPRSVLLEAVFVLECIADRRLQISRLLPPTPLRSLVDTRLALRNDYVPSDRARFLATERSVDISRQRKIIATLLPPMLKAATEDTATQAQATIDAAVDNASRELDGEIARLEALARINPAIRPEEAKDLRRERDALLAALPQARPRLDSLRLIVSADFLQLRG